MNIMHKFKNFNLRYIWVKTVSLWVGLQSLFGCSAGYHICWCCNQLFLYFFL